MGAGASTSKSANGKVTVTSAAPPEASKATEAGKATEASKATYAAREQNPVESAVTAHSKEGTVMLAQLAAAQQTDEEHVPELKDAIFCGHLVADLDSIAGAIGAAELYGGVPVSGIEWKPA